MQQRGQAVIDKILDTAEHLFYTQGYHATGINQVIDEAGIAKASLYKHFQSKTDLMVAYLERFHRQWFERLENAVSKVADPKEKLLALFDHHVERQRIREYGGCPFIKANNDAGMSDARILKVIQQAKERVKIFISHLVAASHHRKLLNDEDLAETIYLLTEGGVAAASVFKQDTDLQTAKAVIQKLI